MSMHFQKVKLCDVTNFSCQAPLTTELIKRVSSWLQQKSFCLGGPEVLSQNH